MLQQTIKNTLETNEKQRNISKETESLSKEIEDKKKNQIEILELKNTITKITNLTDGLKAEWSTRGAQ